MTMSKSLRNLQIDVRWSLEDASYQLDAQELSCSIRPTPELAGKRLRAADATCAAGAIMLGVEENS